MRTHVWVVEKLTSKGWRPIVGQRWKYLIERDLRHYRNIYGGKYRIAKYEAVR